MATVCQLCAASYSCLFDLVSHVRAVHSVEMNLTLVCQVNGCPRMFRKTNTWYKHVVQSHHEEYSKKNPSEFHHEGDDMIDEDVIDEEDLIDEHDGHTESSPEEVQPEGSMVQLSEEVIAGKLLKIREKHLVSYSAISEVVELVNSVCDSMATKCLTAIWQLGEDSGMDTSSAFFQELPQVFEQLSSPLSSVGTAYKQQSFVARNLPYVVRLS